MTERNTMHPEDQHTASADPFSRAPWPLSALLRGRYYIIVSTAAFLILGLLAALLPAPQYGYTSSIEIGSFYRDNEIRLIEHIHTTKAKLESAIIPAVQSLMREQTRGQQEEMTEVGVSLPRKSALLLISTEGPEAESERHRKIHQVVISALAKDHAEKLATYRQSIQTEIDALSSQIERLTAAEARGNEAAALMRLQRQAELSTLNNMLATLKPTEATTTAIRSAKPTNLPPLFLIMASLILGLGLGMGLALVVDYLKTLFR